jgi:MFS family permease
LTDDAAYPDRREAWFFVVVLALAGVMSMIDRTILSIVVDPVRHDLGLTDVDIGLLQGLAFGIFYATVGLPLGLTVDRYSRRLVVIAGIVVWSLATVVSGFAQSFGALFVARLLVGLGEAALSPAAISLIADLFPPSSRGRPISVFLMGQAAANGLGISVTGYITNAAAAGTFGGVPVLDGLAPWRAAFVVCGLLGFVVVALLLPTREPVRRQAGRSGGVVAQVRSSWGYLAKHAGIFVLMYLGFATFFLAGYGAGAWNPTMLMRVFGATRTDLAAILGPLTLAFSIAGPLVGVLLVDAAMRRGDNLERFRILMIAPLVSLPMGLAVFAPNANVAMILIAYSPAVSATIGTTMLALLQSMVPADTRGFAVALTGLLNTIIGAAVGPLLISLLTERVFGDPKSVGISIAWIVVPALFGASAFYFFARNTIRRRVREGTAPDTLMKELGATS